VLALTNVSGREQDIRLPAGELGFEGKAWLDLLSEKRFPTQEGTLALRMKPYEVLWLKAER
jgi:sucrose phosphorylase